MNLKPRSLRTQYQRYFCKTLSLRSKVRVLGNISLAVREFELVKLVTNLTHDGEIKKLVQVNGLSGAIES